MSWYIRYVNKDSHFVKNTEYTTIQMIMTCHLMTWILNLRYIHKRQGDTSRCTCFNALTINKKKQPKIPKLAPSFPGYYFKKPAPLWYSGAMKPGTTFFTHFISIWLDNSSNTKCCSNKCQNYWVQVQRTDFSAKITNSVKLVTISVKFWS